MTYTASPATPTRARCWRRCPWPIPAATASSGQLLGGDVPSPANPPSACRFHTRCPKAQEICSQQEPPLEDKGSGTRVACHFPLTREEVAADRRTIWRMTANGSQGDGLGAEAEELLPSLIRFNTVNPPGNERSAQEYLAAHLRRRDSSASCWEPSPSAPTWWQGLPAEGAPTGPTLCCWATSTPCWRIRPRGHATPGRERSPMASCGAGGRST